MILCILKGISPFKMHQKYQVVPSKAVVGVDPPTKALSMHIQNLIREKLPKFSQLSFFEKLFFLNQTPSCICSMCLHCIGKE